MAMNTSEKTAVLVFSASFVVFWFLIKPRIRLKKSGTGSAGKASMDGFTDKEDDVVSRQPIKVPSINPSELKNRKVFDAFNALKAYITAWNAGESKADLNQMAKDIRFRYSVNVYRKSDGRLAVSDAAGNDIIVNDK
jgi:hypothetical protein